MWTLLLAAAVLWPGRVLAAFDGAPLTGQAEAVLIGVVLPLLWWVHRGFLAHRLVQATIVALLALKLASAILLPQHGLCARFATSAPLTGMISTIAVEEPAGTLRSWDVRADWHAAAPRCTAILDRAYRSQSEFPASFLNILNAIRPHANDLTLDVAGVVTVDSDGTFALDIGTDTTLVGEVGDAHVAAAGGAPVVVSLGRGSHAIDLHAAFKGDRWQFVPLWNGRDAWTSTRMTRSAPTPLDAAASRPVALATAGMIVLLLTAWSWSCLSSLGLPAPALLWSLAAAALMLVLGALGRFERYAGLLLVPGAFAQVAPRDRRMRTALVLVGFPWLAMFVGHAWFQIGRITIYSVGDDWHMYQVAAYRIFLNGHWIEGGSPTFYFQPLYRWVAGALHMLFGDSSVGETYWDAACLLAAALTCFAIVKRLSGFRWGIGAAALTLATFTISPIWHLIGRGLSEITGLGWLCCAALFLMRARRGRPSAALAAGLFAVMMFYTRLNHLLLAAFLPVWLLPARVASRGPAMWHAIRRAHLAPAAIYAVTIVGGVALFATHTWWYAGRFSVLYGTSFGVQQTGLRLATLGSPAVWAKIGEAVGSLLWMHEPPAVDPRSALVVAGAVLSALALLQVPWFNRLPASLALVTVGTIAGSFIAHTHEYPGRMSVHLVPFTVAMSVCALSRLMPSRTRRHVRPAGAAPWVAT